MKTRNWLVLLGGILALCLVLTVVFALPGQKAAYAEVYSQGKLLQRIDLSRDQEITVNTDVGTNVITVRQGKIAVTQADCPDGYCMRRGFCDSGAQIVCLPHRLVIRFVGGSQPDGITG